MTREELLKEMDKFRRQMLTPEQSKIVKLGVDDILQVPTQEQLDCPYCHNDPKQADLLKKYTDDNMYIVYLKSSTLNLEAAGLRTSKKVNYCPICGRRLNDE